MSKPVISQAIVAEAQAGARSVPLALLSLSLCTLLSSLGTSIANVGLPTFATAFAASFQEVQWIVIAYLLGVTTLVVGAGRLGDMIGRRKLLLAGIALFTIASALCGVAPTLWLLIAARALQGFGAAIMMALSMAMVGETVAKSNTGSAMGLLGTMSAIGTALGPSLGGILVSAFGWQAIFLIQVPLGAVTFVLAAGALPVHPKLASSRPHFDIAGMLLLALTLAAYALAVTIGRGSFGLHNALLLCGASVGLVVFLLVEARAASPLLDLRLFRDPSMNASLAASLVVSAVMMTTLVVGPFYLSHALGLPAMWVGAVISVGPVVVALTGVPAGRMADRFGARRMTAAGLSAIGGGALLLSMMPAASGVAGYVVALVVTTAGYALFQTANNTAVMMDIPGDRRGVISGMLNLSRNLGLVTGAAAMGAVFAAASGGLGADVSQPDAVAAGMRTTFAVAAGMVVAALAIVAAGYLTARSRNRAA